MTARAYILMNVEVGKQRAVVGKLRSFPGVQEIDAVHGPYDIIAVVEVSNMIEVGDLVSDRIHEVDGVQHTVTCLVLPAPASP